MINELKKWIKYVQTIVSVVLLAIGPYVWATPAKPPRDTLADDNERRRLYLINYVLSSNFVDNKTEQNVIGSPPITEQTSQLPLPR